MSCSLCTVDPPVLHHLIARTEKTILCWHHSFLQPCCHSDDLKSRARFIGIIQTGVSPHPVQKILLLFSLCCCFFCIQSKRIVQIKFRHIDTGIDFSVLRVHKQYGNSLRLFFFHHFTGCLLHIFLDINIQTGTQSISWHRFLPPFSGSVDLHTTCIRNCEDLSGLSFQDLIVFHFKTNDPLIITSGKSQYFWSERSIRIIPPIILIYLHSLKVIFPDPVSNAFFHVCLYSFNRRNFFNFFSDFLFFYRQCSGQYADHFFRIFDLAVYHRYCADCPVIRQNISPDVQDLSPGRFYVTFPLMKILRLFWIIFCPDVHKIPESSHKSQKKHYADQKNHPYFFPVINHGPDHKKIPLRGRHCNICRSPERVFFLSIPDRPPRW